MYLDAFTFPDADAEYAFFMRKHPNCYTSFYPFQTLCGRLSRLDFEPITVFSGSNGSFGCQFIVATHSIFMLSMKRAKVYDFDEDPVDVKRWSELAVAQTYFDFFREHEDEL